MARFIVTPTCSSGWQQEKEPRGGGGGTKTTLAHATGSRIIGPIVRVAEHDNDDAMDA